jgi:hypothetical protein
MDFVSPLPAGPLEMLTLTLVAILAAPIVVATIVMIVVFEIKDAWDRNPPAIGPPDNHPTRKTERSARL